MNNHPYKMYLGVAVVIVIVVIVWIVSSNRTSPVASIYPPMPNPPTTTPSVASPTSNPPSNKTTNPVVTKIPVSTTPSAPAKTPSSGSTSYENYINQLGANQSACRTKVTTLYQNSYSKTLEASSFRDYYNPKSGICYATIAGQIRAPYATTTTGVLYFRNISAGTSVAECSDSKGNTYSDSDWACTQTATGKSITKAEFNATLYTDTTQ